MVELLDDNPMYGFDAYQRGRYASLSPYFPLDGILKLDIQDIFGKLDSPIQIQWTVSRYCNFTCPHCFNNSGPHCGADEPPRDVIIENICDAKPFNVCLCGGEPFVWPDLFDIIGKLRNGGVPVVSLVTNASLVTPERLAKAVDAGLNNIQISWDGNTPEDHAVSRPTTKSWNRARDAIIACVECGAFNPVAVSFIPNRFNVGAFEQFCEMVAGLGVGSIRCQPLMACGRGAESYDRLRMTAEQTLDLVMKIAAFNRRGNCSCSRDNVLVEWGDPLEHLWFFSETEAPIQMLAIQACGWYELTPYLPVYVGDATRHSIREVWRKPLKQMWRIPVMQQMISVLQVINGMREIKPRIYYDRPVLIDCFDDESWELAQQCSNVDELIAYAERRGWYDNMEGTYGV